MAREIKETPILRGKDAQAFEKALEANKSKRVSSDEFNRAKDAYERIMKASHVD